MERPSAATPAVPGDGLADGPAMEAHPRDPVQADFHDAEPPAQAVLIRRDKGIIDGDRRQLERRDTIDSFQSEFGPPRRTNTGWTSIAGSTTTDMTDLNSPDVAFTDDGLDLEAEIYASSPRRSGLFPVPMYLQKRLPLRALSISSEADKFRTPPYGPPLAATPAPQPRLPGQTSSRKSSLSRSSAFGMPPMPHPQRLQGAPEDEEARAEEQTSEDGWEEETDDGTKVDGDIPTPGRAVADTADDISTPRGSEEGTASHPTPKERPESRCSEAPATSWRDDRDGDGDGDDACASDDGTGPTPNMGDVMIHDVCDQILQRALGVQLHDLAGADAVSAAYESVSYCLDELSHIVLNSGHDNAGIAIAESTRGRIGTANIPIWPVGGVADGAGGGGASGGGHGNGSGGQKRSNGSQDGAGSGDGAGDGGPGGGKRRKVSPTHHAPAGMQLSCPFRKRNPIRFNIRDFQSCAHQSFPDISQLKRHVKTFHRQPPTPRYTCQRCKQPMGSREALEAHASLGKDRICTPQSVSSSANREDGVSDKMEEILNERKADSKIDCWEALWQLLFPEDLEVPEPNFIPPAELDEVYAQFGSDLWTQQLRQQIREDLGQTSSVDSMFAVFTSHINSVFEDCRWRTGGATVGRKRASLQTPRRRTSRPNSRPNTARLNTAPATPAAYHASGIPDNSIPSPIATPNSTGMRPNFEQPLGLEYALPASGYPAARVDVAGKLMMNLAPNGGPMQSQQGRGVTVPPPAHLHLGFGSQEHSTAGQPENQPRLVPMDSGLDLGTAFSDQRPVGFSVVPSFASQDSFPNLRFGQAIPELCGPPLLQDMHGVPGTMFPPTDSDMAQRLAPQTMFCGATGMLEEEFEDIMDSLR